MFHWKMSVSLLAYCCSFHSISLHVCACVWECLAEHYVRFDPIIKYSKIKEQAMNKKLCDNHCLPSDTMLLLLLLLMVMVMMRVKGKQILNTFVRRSE